jgi:hypothetical protein
MESAEDMLDRPTVASPLTVVRLSEAWQVGLTRSRLRGKAWVRVSHGVYASSEGGDSPRRSFEMVQPILPGDALAAHLTAAQRYHFWLPELPSWLPVLAVRPPGVDRPERAGLYVFRSRAGLPVACDVGGVRCVSPEVCLGQLAEDLGLLDLVIAIDSALHLKLCTVTDIERSIRSRQRGLPRLREGLALCDGRSESPWETTLRVLHVVCGFPVEPQFKLRNAAGQVVARADLRIRGTNRLPEYDGADHRERARHQEDLAREKLVQRLGFERYGYVAKEIIDNPGQVLLDAERALGWTHSSGRLKDWWPIFQESSLSQVGRRRLLRRLHRFDRPLRGRRARRTAGPSQELRETG